MAASSVARRPLVLRVGAVPDELHRRLRVTGIGASCSLGWLRQFCPRGTPRLASALGLILRCSASSSQLTQRYPRYVLMLAGWSTACALAPDASLRVSSTGPTENTPCAPLGSCGCSPAPHPEVASSAAVPVRRRVQPTDGRALAKRLTTILPARRGQASPWHAVASTRFGISTRRPLSCSSPARCRPRGAVI
jgi:hypothetical protein